LREEKIPMPPTSARRVILTGAGHGLGRAMAVGLLRAGFDVALVDRDGKALEEVVRLAGDGGGALPIVADLRKCDAASAIVDTVVGEFGGVDGLVNNAALGANLLGSNYLKEPQAFDRVSPELLLDFFHVNAISPILLCQQAVRHMRRQRWGRIVNITTSLDTMLRGGMLPYGGTKASLEAHSAIMAKDLEGTGITVNVLVPGGGADTAMVPAEIAADRSILIRPEVMVAPLLWLLGCSAAAPNGRRVIAASWAAEAANALHPSVSPIGWEGFGPGAILPD
jgi:3-oxoacyl-[acyl-carrier protein] reductase